MPVLLDALVGYASLLAISGSYENAYQIAVVVLNQMEASEETRARRRTMYGVEGQIKSSNH
jgi:hypothetical protein